MDGAIIDYQTWQLIISAVTGFCNVLPAIAVAIIAYIGLSTWRKQLKGTAEYELAKRLLRSVYKVRDAMNDVIIKDRHINPGEIVNLIKENSSKLKYFIENQNDRFESKLNKLSDALNELDLEAIQAEVLWGQDVDVKKPINDIRKIVNDFSRNIYQYLKILNEPEPIGWTAEQHGEWERLLRFVSGVEENPFEHKIKKSIEIIEGLFKRFMRV